MRKYTFGIALLLFATKPFLKFLTAIALTGVRDLDGLIGVQFTSSLNPYTVCV